MRTVLALLVFASFALAGAREQFRQALLHKQKGDTARANVCFRAVLEIDPDHRAARRALGYRKCGKRWVRSPSERQRANAALRRCWASTAATRANALLEIRALEREERLRAFVIALRNRHLDVRLHAIEALGRSKSPAVIKPLVAHLQRAGGNWQRAYIAQTTQVSYVQDFDVEVA